MKKYKDIHYVQLVIIFIFLEVKLFYSYSGKTRGEFVNTLVKINIHQFSNANAE